MLYEYIAPIACIGFIIMGFVIAYRWLDAQIANDSAQWQRNQRAQEDDDECYP